MFLGTFSGIRFFAEILPGLGFAITAHPYIPYQGVIQPDMLK